LFPRSPTESVNKVLSGLGFHFGATLPAMAIDIEKLPATSISSKYHFERLTDISKIEAWTEAMGFGYGLPPSLAPMFSPVGLGLDTALDAPVQFYSVEDDGWPVATSVIYLANGVAGIYCVCTLPDHRRNGLGAHVTAEPLRIIQRLGYRVGILQASADGHPVYKRLGFEDFGAIHLFVRMPQ